MDIQNAIYILIHLKIIYNVIRILNTNQNAICMIADLKLINTNNEYNIIKVLYSFKR
jgi:hypothetical protein